MLGAHSADPQTIGRRTQRSGGLEKAADILEDVHSAYWNMFSLWRTNRSYFSFSFCAFVHIRIRESM